ncbi:MAG: DUF4384 domain-containing protein [Spirochaetes bacterium]|nr:DUF4384 domain-containing protein [Spirochaetota bacterium]
MSSHARGAALAVAAIALMLGIPAFRGGAQSQGGATLTLKWALIGLEKGGTKRVIDFSATPSVRAGDRLQVYIEALTSAYVYLFLYDSNKDLTLLYPEAPRAPALPGGEGGGRLLPGEEEWFAFDEARGEEQFYLLASTKRLARLEDLTAAWVKNTKSAEAKARVLDEIKAQRRLHSGLTAAVEKGVPMAGTFQSRALKPDIIGEATLVEAKGFYIRTLRFAHE